MSIPSAKACADQILTAVPLVMRHLWTRVQLEAPVSMTWGQFTLLSFLSERRLTMTQLTRYWGVSKPSMSKMVATLMERGWLDREEDPKDRRRKPLDLTPTGRQVYEDVRKAARPDLIGVLETLDGEQRAQIAATLDLLAEILA